MFGFPKLNKEKIYKMHLCMIDDENIAINGDIYGDYYASSEGSFRMHPNFTVINEIYVKKAKKHGYVEEISTGIEIPFVLLQITPGLKGNRYECCPFGNTSYLAVAFAVQKTFQLEKQPDQEFILTEVGEEQKERYLQEKSEDTTWKKEIYETLFTAMHLKGGYLLNALESIYQKGPAYYYSELKVKQNQKQINALTRKK